MTLTPHLPCAFCGTTLTRTNISLEHVFQNAIGGRKTVDNFICSNCNSKTGANWDAALVEQLRPLCTMLNIKRSRRCNRPFVVETSSQRKLTVHPDGSMTIAEPIFDKRQLGNKSAVRIHARTMREMREMVTGLKRKHSQIDTDEVMKKADRRREYLREPYAITLNVGGPIAGRAMIKSCLALAYDAGSNIGDCREAESYLLKDGQPCFGYYNERDVVKNRPKDTFFHCIYVCGDPTRGQLLAYVEYFGWLRIVARLSNAYDGMAFSHCYAIDPVSGKELNLDVELMIEPADIPEIYDYRKVDNSEVGRALGAVVEAWGQMDRERAQDRAVKDALKFACDECGISEGDILSDEQAAQFARVVAQRLEPFLAHMIGLGGGRPAWQHGPVVSR